MPRKAAKRASRTKSTSNDVAALMEIQATFDVPPELAAELLESIDQAERGETISAEEMLKRLRRIARAK